VNYPDIPTAITRRESNLIADLTAGKHVLEIGSYLGYSTVWMALNGATVVAVDPHEWMDSRLEYEANLRRYNITRIETIYALSQDAVGMLPRGAFDAAFIDGDHSYENATFDLRLARDVVRSGGWILAHDYTFPGYNGGGWPGVIQAVDEVLGDLREVRREGCLYAARLDPAVDHRETQPA
jgi:predicted O-methyltransferase YrrM